MTRASAVLVVAGCAYLLSWFLPVTDGFPGWQAFRASLGPIWPYESSELLPWPYVVVAASGALTNVLFVAVFVDLATRRRLGRVPVVLALAVAAGINLCWLVITGDGRTDLRIGYYLWVCSFLILIGAAVSLGAFRVRDG